MKKLLIILAILVLAPITVNAASINTSFNQDDCKLEVTGEQTGHEAQVSMFINDTFKGMVTATINNGNYQTEFILAYDQDTTIDLTVADENGANLYKKENITVPACTITTPQNNKIVELFDNQGNSIIIKDANTGFETTDKFDLEIQSKEDVDQILENFKNTPDYDTYKNMFDKMMASIGEGNTFKYYILPSVLDKNDNTIDYTNYNDGFTLNLLYSKDDYKKLNNLKLISVDNATLNKIKELNYTYDEQNEVFIISIDRPGIILAYEDNTISNTTNNPNTGDKINRYIILLTISTLGLIGVGIYTKKKIFNK